jgi:hypothetical protein
MTNDRSEADRAHERSYELGVLQGIRSAADFLAVTDEHSAAAIRSGLVTLAAHIMEAYHHAVTMQRERSNVER